jgi:hypothetical protein
LSIKTALAMLFKLIEGAQKTRRRLDGQDGTSRRQTKAAA